VRSTTLFIAVFLLAASPAAGAAGPACGVCHRTAVRGAHAGLACASCHVVDGETVRDPSAAAVGAGGCVSCHAGRGKILDGPMSRRSAEREFVSRTMGRLDPEFFRTECGSCHLSGCLDCHEGGGHAVSRPTGGSCLKCHAGYFVGAEYAGLAPREESPRYARGVEAGGDLYLKMAPDVHAERGMSCGDCHSMKSLAAGKRSSKTCTDCHEAGRDAIEHRIGAHLSRLECYACHAAWAAQEYGTFYVRIDGKRDGAFALRHRTEKYARSVYLRKQDAPPLGIDRRGKVSPIRPQFILYYSDGRDGAGDARAENRLLAASWKAFFPHTVRRGTIMCGGCHDDPRRLVLEGKADRIYGLAEDGMGLASFWDRTGQGVVNGSFRPRARAARLFAKGPAYRKAFVRKWKTLIDRAGRSSGP
jgi:hypothetical protein